MARYELSDGKSNKFWEIIVKGSSFTTTYGRIGADGQSKTKEFASAAKAKAEAEKLTTQKVKKGYAKAKGGKKAITPSKSSKKTVAPKKAAKTASKKAPAKKGKAKTAKAKTVAGFRFELTDGKSAKFWHIHLDGDSFTTTYGRIGTDGTSGSKSFASAAAAKKKHDALIAEKTKKGYVLVAGDLPKSMTVQTAQNKAMEAAIASDPSDESAWAVYADWLQAQGDPRGELAAVQMSLASSTGATKTKLKRSQTKLFTDYGEHFTPPIITQLEKSYLEREPKKSEKWRHKSWKKEERLALSWGHGFIESLDLLKAYNEPTRMEDILAAILSHPSGRLLRKLKVGSLNIGDTYSYRALVDIIAKAKPLLLTELYLADFHSEQCELSWSEFGKLGPLWKAAPNLEDVTIHAGNFDLGTVNLPRARSFAVQTGGLSGRDFKSIAKATWPALEKLELWFGTANYGASTTVKMVAPLLDGKNIPKVTDLGLMNGELVDELCKLLPKAKIAKRLQRLDLSMGIMTDAGAEALAAKPKAFPKLAVLDVSDNYLTAAGLKMLKPLAKKLITGRQKTPDEWDDEIHRYVSVGE